MEYHKLKGLHLILFLYLYVLEDIQIKIGETIFIDLGIQCEMVNNDKNIGYYLYPRSSISKTPLILANSVGIIDSGYRGNIKACFDLNKNHESYDNFKIESGNRYVQITPPNIG